jgi:hypothetical protein
MSFEVLVSVKTEASVFCVVTPRWPIGGYQGFGTTRFLQLQPWKCSSETSVLTYKYTRHYSTEDRIVHDRFVTGHHYVLSRTGALLTDKHLPCLEILLPFGVSLSGYALLNVSRTGGRDFDANWCSRMSTRSAGECICTAFAHLAWVAA